MRQKKRETRTRLMMRRWKEGNRDAASDAELVSPWKQYCRSDSHWAHAMTALSTAKTKLLTQRKTRTGY